MRASGAQDFSFESLLVSLLLFLLVSYFMFIYPQKKRKTQHQRFLTSIKIGDVVQLYGGVIGEVVEISSETAHLKTDSDSYLMASTQHIVKVHDNISILEGTK